MPDTSYTDGVTVIVADTMNDLNRLHYTILGDPTTIHDVRKKIWVKGSNTSSATTVTVPTDGNFFHITGTTEIQGFSTINNGFTIQVVFDDVLTLKHDSLSLILPGGTSILTAAGDSAIFVNESASSWRCLNYTSAAPSGVPAGFTGSYAGSAAPSGWLLCFGQAISRTTYAGLFAAISTVYGVGDGSTTFNIPDIRGRSISGKDDMGGVAASRITAGGSGITGTTLGTTGGLQNHTLLVGETPVKSHTHGITDSGHVHGITDPQHAHGVKTAGGGSNVRLVNDSLGDGTYNSAENLIGTNTTGISINNAGTGISINAASDSAATAHNNMQPTIIMNMIIKY